MCVPGHEWTDSSEGAGYSSFKEAVYTLEGAGIPASKQQYILWKHSTHLGGVLLEDQAGVQVTGGDVAGLTLHAELAALGGQLEHLLSV